MEHDLNVTSRGLTVGRGESHVTAGGEQNEQFQNEGLSRPLTICPYELP